MQTADITKSLMISGSALQKRGGTALREGKEL